MTARHLLAGLLLFLFLLASTTAEAKPRARHHKHSIAFWIAGLSAGATREDAVLKCSESNGGATCRKPFPVRGPYLRKHKGSDPDDDPKVFVYRGENGQWFDRDGNFPGCDPSGCP